MNMIPYLVIAGILCIAALVGTIMIGVNPKDEEYDTKTKKHFTNMSIIYFVTFVPAIILTVLFFVYR